MHQHTPPRRKRVPNCPLIYAPSLADLSLAFASHFRQVLVCHPFVFRCCHNLHYAALNEACPAHIWGHGVSRKPLLSTRHDQEQKSFAHCRGGPLTGIMLSECAPLFENLGARPIQPQSPLSENSGIGPTRPQPQRSSIHDREPNGCGEREREKPNPEEGYKRDNQQRASSFSSSSSGKTNDSKNVVNSEEFYSDGKVKLSKPVIPKQLEPNIELQNVTQYSDGKVKLSFRRSTSSTFSDKDSCSSIPSLERKFSKIPSIINLPFQPVKSQPRFSTSDIPSSSIHSVDYTTSVPHPIYTSSQYEQRQEEKKPSPPTSPAFSAVT
ncbi:hypothetical protein WN944_009282 [Citrus x changshan-huyou]|uniref:Uncharacterized protein n=1 Tax=Citrus x changshan-huyou TaxID=2935761 RepID=A0AAP0QW38_9ROSI